MKKVLIVVMLLVLFAPSISFAKFVGPYTGQIIDSQTGEPINGATVLFYWTKEVYQIMHSSSAPVRAESIQTDKSGRYEIPKIFINLGLSSKYESLNIIVYEAGYKAFIKRLNYLSTYSKPDPNFKEKNYIIKLDRIPSKFDHYEHSDEIDDALRGIDDDRKLRVLIEEFKRRYEWEERRGLYEKYGERK